MKNMENLVLETTQQAAPTMTVLPASDFATSMGFTAEEAEHDATIDDLFGKGAIDSVKVFNVLKGWEADRLKWEGNELAASHARLYAILTKCYSYYLAMKSATTSTHVRKQLVKGLNSFISARGFRTLDKTHDMNKVVKAIFGEDRRRVSAYSMALRVALTTGAGNQHVPADDLAEWIEKQGGIEEIRQGSKSGGMTEKERADVAATAVKDAPLMTFKPDTKAMMFGSNDADKMMVLVVTYRPTGDIEVNTVIKSGAVVRAALAAHYAEHKEQMIGIKASEELSKPTAVSMALGNNSN